MFADAFTERYLEASAFESRAGAVEDCENAPPVGDPSQYEYVSEEIDGDAATVTVEWTSDSSSGTTIYELALDGDRWLIDGFER